MKQSLIARLGIFFFLIPFLVYLSRNPVCIYISKLGFIMQPIETLLAAMLLTLVWFLAAKIRRACFGKAVFGIAYDLLPIQIILLLVFAQYHVWLAFMLLFAAFILVIAGHYYLGCLMKEYEGNIRKQVNKKKQLTRIRKRFAVLSISIVFLFPSYQSVFIYKLQTPAYMAEEEFLFDADVYRAEVNNIEQLLINKSELCNKLQEDNWALFSLEERLYIMQEVAYIEAEYLGVTKPKIEAKKLDDGTLGGFESVACRITIDAAHLQDDNAKKCLTTLCHEMYHCYQYYVVNLIDWDRDSVNHCLYYETARKWKENFEYYHDEDYETYYQQCLERDAREYSEKEVRIYLTYINAEG